MSVEKFVFNVGKALLANLRFLFILTLENEEAEKILLKTMFRRSKAFMELGHHQRALNDISFCLRTQVNNTGNANNVLSIFWEVRNKPGLKTHSHTHAPISKNKAKLNFAELSHVREYHLATARWKASHPSVHSDRKVSSATGRSLSRQIQTSFKFSGLIFNRII